MFHNSNFKIMNANVQITAVKKEFKNGTQGYEVKVEGLDGKLNCSMNFHDPLKSMRYMFMLSKRLDLKIDKIQLTALSLDYQRAKEAEQKAIEDANAAAQELAVEEDEEPAEDKPSAEVEAEVPEETPAESSEPATVPDSLFPEEKPTEPEDEKGLTPMMKQFKDLKKKHPDALLLFRCGDFYETYGDDAKDIANILAITLTRRTSLAMAGFPYHALDAYLPKLIRAGRRVAICDQIEDPKSTKRVKRGITELVKPAEKTEMEAAV